MAKQLLAAGSAARLFAAGGRRRLRSQQHHYQCSSRFECGVLKLLVSRHSLSVNAERVGATVHFYRL